MTTATSKRNAVFAYAACLAVLGGLMGVVLFGGNAVTPMQSAIADPQLSASVER
jgi:hypothetical protein